MVKEREQDRSKVIQVLRLDSLGKKRSHHRDNISIVNEASLFLKRRVENNKEERCLVERDVRRMSY